MKHEVIIFDLDGTLFETIEDLPTATLEIPRHLDILSDHFLYPGDTEIDR